MQLRPLHCTRHLVDNLSIMRARQNVKTRRVQALPAAFKSQGEVILGKAEAMGESVGHAHLGFMAEVQEEMQVCGLNVFILYELISVIDYSLSKVFTVSYKY